MKNIKPIFEPPAHGQQPETYETRTLTVQDIPAFLALQERMKPHLSKSYHLKGKDEAYLAAHLESGMQIVGCVTKDGTLAAATILTDAFNPVAQLGEFQIEDMTVQTIGMQAVMVDPAHQRNGLSAKLFDKAKELYPDADFVAKVATDNTISRANFQKWGFAETRTVTSVDKRDGTAYEAVFFIRKNDAQPQHTPVCAAAQPVLAFGG